MANNYRYFLYSDEQVKEKNEILSSTGKSFECGTVVVNGSRKKFSQMSTEPTMDRFIDTVIVAEGDKDSFIYSMPKNIKKRGN